MVGPQVDPGGLDLFSCLYVLSPGQSKQRGELEDGKEEGVKTGERKRRMKGWGWGENEWRGRTEEVGREGKERKEIEEGRRSGKREKRECHRGDEKGRGARS